MVLSAALDSGYIFISLIGILTSVIGAVYYLNVIKEIFFYTPEHEYNPLLSDYLKSNLTGEKSLNDIQKVTNKEIYISSPFSITISIITLVILLFIFMNKE